MAKITEQPQTVTLDQILEMVERLPLEQQATLVHVIEKRRQEASRAALIESVQESKAEFERGEYKSATVAEIMRAALEP
jgi:hypothetical protein